ncbi:DUF397 domain-containing protein [Streptomyces sp. H51]|uniref:DUF397 domain-containing protein n=1 Tax=Streptomyces sp. H51 TaxID=3111770 RepID=UPI002D78ADB8|nr:DUF397 domain-containing protein [Streptomyces sp. H51]
MQAIHWQRSSHSGDGSNCVEIATTPSVIHVRDSKRPTAPHLTLTPTTWTAFLPYAAQARRRGARP